MIEYRDKISLMKSAQSGKEESINLLKERNKTVKVLNITGTKGYNWTISLTEPILKMVKHLENKYYRLDLKDISNLIEEATYSAVIEGANITLPESMAICKKTINAKTKSEKMVRNTFNAIRYSNNIKNITEKEILEIWKIITYEVCDNLDIKGEKYRNATVTVGNNIKVDYIAPQANKVQSMMNELIKFITDNTDRLHPFIKAPIIHFILVYIHPFCDGNGRLSRLLLNDFLIRSGFDKFKKMSLTSSVYDKIDSYYKNILLCEKYEPDLTYFVVYYLNAIEKLFDKIESGLKPRKLDENFSNIQIKAINKLRKDSRRVMNQDSCARDNNITKEEAAKELNNLVDRGYLHKVRKEKVYYKWWEYDF